ncbi:MAG: hypothetical protein O4805_10895 [Trichodesmium sp. St16_bin2-tuft]|nr:hypothetical protein [Trichodesmium sp. St16_bin2-tuft]
MFGFNGNNNNAKMPKQGYTTITPDNYGYSYAFIDDDSQMVFEWEQNGCLPTPELAAKAKQTADERTKQASLSKQIRRNLAKVSKANAEIVKNFGATKLTAAQSAKKQYGIHTTTFNGMDKLQTDYNLAKVRRSQRIAEIQSSHQNTVSNLRSNSNSRQRAGAANKN